MLEFVTKTKKWGNSVGVVIPKELGIPEGQQIHVVVEPAQRFTRVKDIFGKHKFKQDIKSLLNEVDEELDW